MIYTPTAYDIRFAGLRKISASGNLLIALLIRRASRATFPDMGRLTDSPLPTIKVKTTKQFCFLLLVALHILFYIAIIPLYRLAENANLLNTLTY